jgi:hypothetical protein
MPVPAEKIAPGRCFRCSDNELRRVLLLQDNRVTFVMRGSHAWNVLRTYQDVESFAALCEAEIDAVTLADVP